MLISILLKRNSPTEKGSMKLFSIRFHAGIFSSVKSTAVRKSVVGLLRLLCPGGPQVFTPKKLIESRKFLKKCEET